MLFVFFVGLQISRSTLEYPNLMVFEALFFPVKITIWRYAPIKNLKKPHPDPVKLRKLLEVSSDGNDTI